MSACPVNCIHPTPDEPDFGSTDMLYIDPKSCIDFGACVDACPVDAIFPIESLLAGPKKAYPKINADYFDAKADPAENVDPAPNFHTWNPPVFNRSIPSDFPELNIAVVGTGPAGMYAVEDLLLHTKAKVTLIDRLPAAGGLIRYGVAPDHPATKKIAESFARFYTHPRLKMRLGLQIGKDLTVQELSAQHHAVIYAVGASSARSLAIPGENLSGSIAATDVVAWYNGHPEATADVVDLSAERIVIVGNGNVALDVARVLCTDPQRLAGTSISPVALGRLRESKIREIVILGRRGPDEAAYTSTELIALTEHDDVELVVDANDPRVAQDIADATGGKAALLKTVRQEQIDWSAPPAKGKRRIVLKFHSEPQEILGKDAVSAVVVSENSEPQEINTGALIRAIGYRGVPTPGLPFDERSGTIPHDAGRVAGLPGNYVVGWIKRGPSGGIGANKTCVQETVAALISDVVTGVLPVPRRKRTFALRDLKLPSKANSDR
ncbi:FAD-dependent oxidoreductase [Renibacterium salmoninarum]|nr:FAD-dependent oxidoreductase [Renibacterium salmoninarum]